MGHLISTMLIAAALAGTWAIVCAVWFVVRVALFTSYRRQVAAECGADEGSRFTIVAGGARPQQIYAGVVRVGEEWLVGHGVPLRSLAGRN